MMKTTKSKIAVVAVLLLAGGGGAYFFKTKPAPVAGSTPTTTTTTTAAKGLALSFVPNTTYTYALHYGSKTKAVPMMATRGSEPQEYQTVEGDLDLEGTFTIHAYGRDAKDEQEGTSLVGVTLSDCKGHFRVGDQPAWPSDANGCKSVFDRKELLVMLERSGKVRSIYATEGGASLFDYALRAIVEETQLRLAESPGTQAWVEVEPLPQGNAESLYRLVSIDTATSTTTIERTRQRYLTLTAATMLDGELVKQNVSARHTIELREGALAKLQGKESLKASTTAAGPSKTFLDSSTEIDLVSKSTTTDNRERPILGRYIARALEDMPESKSLDTRMLEQRAAGLSWTEALDTIEHFGEAENLPDHSRFLWRVTALMALDAKRAWDLVPLFDNARGGGHLRGLIFDLLASTSTPEAQKVMRQLLSSEKGKSDPRYGQLFQRMSFVDAPDKDSIAFVKARYTEASSSPQKNRKERLAAAYTMGSMADRTKGSDTSKELVDDLTRGLRDAKGEDIVFFLRALANADSPLTFGTFASYAKNPDPDVREAVADALDDPPLPESLALLLELAADSNRDVQHAALKSLRAYKLSATVIRRLTEIASTGAIHPENVRHVLDLVKTYRFVFPAEMDGLLRTLLASPVDDVLVRAATQQLLDAR